MVYEVQMIQITQNIPTYKVLIIAFKEKYNEYGHWLLLNNYRDAWMSF